MTVVRNEVGVANRNEGVPLIETAPDTPVPEQSPELQGAKRAYAAVGQLLQAGRSHDSLVERDTEAATRSLETELARVTRLRGSLHVLLQRLEENRAELKDIADRLQQIEAAIAEHETQLSEQQSLLDKLDKEKNDSIRWLYQQRQSIRKLQTSQQHIAEDPDAYNQSMMELGVEGAAFVPEQAPRTPEEIIDDEIRCSEKIGDLNHGLVELRSSHQQLCDHLREVLERVKQVEEQKQQVVQLLHTDDLPVVTSRRQMTTTETLLAGLEVSD